ncbi:hypothetical protein U9M48_027419 [Paspalum notatum var. saurae]|uniref:Uncharacterized protein n=1 Tax=Paspalum notatum var. saurae TaxID=547442 RepID=A0AAQ3TV47_PASNO
MGSIQTPRCRLELMFPPVDVPCGNEESHVKAYNKVTLVSFCNKMARYDLPCEVKYSCALWEKEYGSLPMLLWNILREHGHQKMPEYVGHKFKPDDREEWSVDVEFSMLLWITASSKWLGFTEPRSEEHLRSRC